jgi:endonuclease/exonuclease/phosphatase family metal-dependent hydrolase
VHFGALRRSFQNAVEEARTGLVTTWLSLCPVLALDHIWLSEHFVPVRTTLRRTLHSDHALVMTDVSLDKTREPRAQPGRSTDE